MKQILIITILLLFHFSANAQSREIPKWFVESFTNHHLNVGYTLTPFLRPAFLSADFNGEKITDIAVLVIEKKSKKKGVVLIDGKTKQYYLFGAGVKFGNGGSDFSWLKQWRVYNHTLTYETQVDKDGALTESKKNRLHHPGILIMDEQDGEPTSGGIIYWNNSKYIWIQQGE